MFDKRKTMRKPSIIKLLFAPLLVFILTGCSGSGASNSSTISGVAAAGSTLAGTVYLKDSSTPAKELSIPIAADGSFSFNLEGLTAPFLLKAAGTANGDVLTLFSFASASGTININPLSNLSVALANDGADLQGLYDSPDPVKMHTILNALPSAIATVQTVLQPMLAKFGVATVNFISDPYKADHQGIDLFLDIVGIRFNNGFVFISDKQTNYNINMTLDDFKTRSIDIMTAPIPAFGSVFVTPNPAVVAPNATLNFSAVVIGSVNTQVTWSVVEDNGGTITNSGAYTAPSTPGFYHVTATNASDATESVTVSVEVSGENVLRMVSAGSGVYAVLADNFTGVAAIEFVITYDTSLLANPQVTSGALAAGALVVNNTRVPGTVKWALITTKPISGSGSLASISFDLLGASPGRILSLRANLLNSTGRTVGTTVLIAPPAGTIL
jgi:cohesin domain-containing protein